MEGLFAGDVVDLDEIDEAFERGDERRADVEVTSDIKEVLFLETGLIRFVLFEECSNSVVEEDPAVVVHLLVETLVDAIVHKRENLLDLLLFFFNHIFFLFFIAISLQTLLRWMS